MYDSMATEWVTNLDALVEALTYGVGANNPFSSEFFRERTASDDNRGHWQDLVLRLAAAHCDTTHSPTPSCCCWRLTAAVKAQAVLVKTISSDVVDTRVPALVTLINDLVAQVRQAGYNVLSLVAAHGMCTSAVFGVHVTMP